MSALLARLRDRLPRTRRQRFAIRCAAAGLSLDYDANREGLEVLEEVFRERYYGTLFPLFEPDTAVVDIGAHYGYFSLFAARNLGPGSRVVACEPDRAAAAVWRRNLGDNPTPGVATRLIEVAVTDRAGTARLSDGHQAERTLLPTDDAAAADTTLVRAATLAEVLSEGGIDRVDFLKMDCEGSEFDILLGAPDALLRRVHTISLEYHAQRPRGLGPRVLVERLVSSGMRVAHLRAAATNHDNHYGQLVATRTALG